MNRCLVIGQRKCWAWRLEAYIWTKSHAVREKHWAVVLQCNTWKCQIDFLWDIELFLYLLDRFVQYFLMHTFCIVITWPSFRLALYKYMFICAWKCSFSVQHLWRVKSFKISPQTCSSVMHENSTTANICMFGTVCLLCFYCWKK